MLPGARKALAAVRAAGAPAQFVITAKYEVTARLSMDAAGLAADGIFADVHGPQKAAVLADLGAAVFVGDTPADMAAAAEAGARAIGVSDRIVRQTLPQSGGRGPGTLVAGRLPSPVRRARCLTLVTHTGVNRLAPRAGW